MINSTAICIVTHSKRFEIFKKTLQSIKDQIDLPIYVAINGDYGKSFDDDYRSNILQYCIKFNRVYCNFYLTFRGLSKIWNDSIINCGAEHIIVTNDDILVDTGFFEEFLSHIEKHEEKQLFRVNDSFSTFYVNKRYIDSCGYFNEHYLGIGWEDFEFTKRNISGEYPTYVSNKYKNLSSEYRDLVDQNASIEAGKYHRFNHNIFSTQEILKGINFRPYEKYYMENYNTFWTY